MVVLFQTPGPGTYDTADPSIYKDKAPLYSMTSRNVMPGDTTRKPGPGAHSPETVRSTTLSFSIKNLNVMESLEYSWWLNFCGFHGSNTSPINLNPQLFNYINYTSIKKCEPVKNWLSTKIGSHKFWWFHINKILLIYMILL